jgi:hypothetical protein
MPSVIESRHTAAPVSNLPASRPVGAVIAQRAGHAFRAWLISILRGDDHPFISWFIISGVGFAIRFLASVVLIQLIIFALPAELKTDETFPVTLVYYPSIVVGFIIYCYMQYRLVLAKYIKRRISWLFINMAVVSVLWLIFFLLAPLDQVEVALIAILVGLMIEFAVTFFAGLIVIVIGRRRVK